MHSNIFYRCLDCNTHKIELVDGKCGSCGSTNLTTLGFTPASDIYDLFDYIVNAEGATIVCPSCGYISDKYENYLMDMAFGFICRFCGHGNKDKDEYFIVPIELDMDDNYNEEIDLMASFICDDCYTVQTTVEMDKSAKDFSFRCKGCLSGNIYKLFPIDELIIMPDRIDIKLYFKSNQFKLNYKSQFKDVVEEYQNGDNIDFIEAIMNIKGVYNLSVFKEYLDFQ